MLPALGKPIVVRAMERVKVAGIQKIIVVMGENEGELASYLNHFWLPEVEIEFVLKSPAKSMVQVLRDIASKYPEPLLVAAYNAFTHTHSIERLIRHYEARRLGPVVIAAANTLTHAPVKTAALVEDVRIMSIDMIEQIQNDPMMYLGEIAIVDSRFWQFVKKQPLSISRQGLMQHMRDYVAAGGTAHIAVTNWLLPVHVDSDLLTLSRYLLEQGGETHILSEVPASVRIMAPVRIDANVTIGQNASIGPYVYLESGSRVGAGCHVEHAVVMRTGAIKPGEQVWDTIIV